MILKSLRVHNFKAFKDTGFIEFAPSITVFAGRNNSGKSALLEGIRFIRFPNRPFRTGPKDSGNGPSIVEARLLISGTELWDAVKHNAGGGRIVIPIDGDGIQDKDAFVNRLFSTEQLEFTLSRQGDGQVHSPYGPSHGLFETKEIVSYIAITADADGNPINDTGIGPPQFDSLPSNLAPYIDKRIFVFSAQRTVGSIEKFRRTDNLDPVGANLPSALNTLQGSDPRKFQKYKNYVQSIISDITNVSVEPANDDNIDIRVWSAADSQGGELSVSLSECGTGVGQILALVYAAMTERPAIIAIDEPNSFLHPSAVKNLINILDELNNQYVFTTHSSDIISRVRSGRIFNITRKEGSVSIEEVNASNISQIRSMLDDLGVSLADVLGLDEVVWVEGATEAEVFPKILIASGHRNIPAFLAIKNTGDFHRRKSQIALIFDMYRKISMSSNVSPTKVRFSFDRESLSQTQMADLKREAKEAVYFTDRRLLENYILNAPSICRVISRELNHIDPPSMNDAISYIEILKRENGDDAWEKNIDGSKTLSRMFDELTNCRLAFKKPRHPVLIVEDLIEHDFTHLDPLKNYVRQLCN